MSQRLLTHISLAMSAGCNTACGHCKANVHGHSEVQQPRHGAFSERVSVSLIGLPHRTEHSNGYIVMPQKHFTKWIEGAEVPSMEAILVADVIMQKWVYKRGMPLKLHSDRETEFTAAMHRRMCDLLGIHKTYLTVYRGAESSLPMAHPGY